MEESFRQGMMWAQAHILNQQVALQFGLLIAAGIVAWLLGRKAKEAFDQLRQTLPDSMMFHQIIQAFTKVLFPLMLVLFSGIGSAIFQRFGLSIYLLQSAITLSLAWIAIRFLTSFITRHLLAKWLALTLWGIAALHILGILQPTIAFLDSLAFKLGDARISLLILIKGLVAFALFLWAAVVLAGFVDRRIRDLPDLTPSLQVLLSKMIRILLIALAIVVGLNTIGIDLTAFAVFGGAVGVGLGFGLQKVVSNFVSGIILLMDRSIKPGDVIVVDDTYGWVNKLSTRHVSIITRDGKEHLVPNEFLITEKVENWSYSNRNVRLKIPFGIAYTSDVHKAIALSKEVAEKNSRVLQTPKPNCLIKGFGDSSVDLELRVWITDPNNGVSNITSDIYLAIWDSFHENGIEFPFPQRDIHVKTLPEAWETQAKVKK